MNGLRTDYRLGGRIASEFYESRKLQPHSPYPMSVSSTIFYYIFFTSSHVHVNCNVTKLYRGFVRTWRLRFREPSKFYEPERNANTRLVAVSSTRLIAFTERSFHQSGDNSRGSRRRGAPTRLTDLIPSPPAPPDRCESLLTVRSSSCRSQSCSLDLTDTQSTWPDCI